MTRPSTWGLLALLCCGFLLNPAPVARAESDQVKALLQQAEFYEKEAQWDKACDAYENLLRQQGAPVVRERYQHCLRRLWQTRRQRDVSYRKEVLSLDYGQALRLYSIIRDTLL